MLSDFEKREIGRIITQRVGDSQYVTQKEMEWLISKFIKVKKGVSIQVTLMNEMDHQDIMLFPHKAQESLNMLFLAYDKAFNYFSNNNYHGRNKDD